jgi:hypothetical protein
MINGGCVNANEAGPFHPVCFAGFSSESNEQATFALSRIFDLTQKQFMNSAELIVTMVDD